MSDVIKLTYWYEHLTLESLSRISDFYDQNVFFKDPFNEFEGLSLIQELFTHMFQKLEKPRFVFIDIIENENTAFLTWDFYFVLNKKEMKIHGSTHLKFNPDKKVIYHRDYWDVGEEVLLKIPIIKFLYTYFRRTLSSV